MLSSPPKETFEYFITILTVKMKIRFPCKMKIEQTGTLLTNEVTPQNDLFTFNQEIVLQG